MGDARLTRDNNNVLPRRRRAALLLALICIVVLTAVLAARGARSSVPPTPPAPTITSSLVGAYADPAQLTELPFGAYSHWLHPWRAYVETVSAAAFLNGTGVNLDLGDMPSGVNIDLVMHMLAVHGIHHARIEIGWGQLDYATRAQFAAAPLLAQALGAARRYGIRPLILLNANHGAPCPLLMFSRPLAADARPGDTSIQLADTSGLVVGYSGLSNLSDYWAAEAIVTGVSGHTVTLSKPLPRSFRFAHGARVLKAGTLIPLGTLRYRPFGPPGTQAYTDTIAGWQEYVGTVAGFAAATLGTQASPDKGFDLEIWNELTFGSRFLDIDNYYTLRPYRYPAGTSWAGIIQRLVQATVDEVDAHPALFAGVQISDGFANTIPWPASSQEPERIGAISKHPYMDRQDFGPHSHDDRPEGLAVDALGQVDLSAYSPSYSALFPEYYGEALKSETVVRDLAPFATDIYGVGHGRSARAVDGRIIPCPVWITEAGIAPDHNGVAGVAAALALKAKTTARYFAFYLNKGAAQLDLYAAFAGDEDFGIVQDNFIAYARTHGTYPAADAPYTSPALLVTGRIAAVMRAGLDPALTPTRTLTVDAIGDTHNHDQFVGDGTAAHPTLYDRDVFAFLPYQVNATRFVVPYYVMTRDVTKGLSPEEFTVRISGLHAHGTIATAYDPISDRPVPVVIRATSATSLTLTLSTTDYPYLLIIQEKSATS